MSETGGGAGTPGGLVKRPDGASAFDGWSIARLTGVFPGNIGIDLSGPEGATLSLVLSPRGTRALVQTRFGAIAYRKFTGIPEASAGKVAKAFAAKLEAGELPLPVLFPHLSLTRTAEPGEAARVRALLGPMLRAALPAAVGAVPTLRTLFFDPPGLAEFLAPELVVGGAPVSGHVLRSITLPPTGNRSVHDLDAYVLEFMGRDAQGTDAVVRVLLGTGTDANAFGTAGPLWVRLLGHTGEPDALPATWSSIASWLLTILRMRWDAGVTFTRPNTIEELRALSVPATNERASVEKDDVPAAAPAALNVALDAECGQACVFCSVKRFVRPFDGGEAQRDTLLGQLRRARERGTTELRLNGIDPLAFTRVLDVVAAARDLGFTRLEVYSPGHRLADASFRKEFLLLSPPNVRLHLPVYGRSAAVHDAVTGRPGSHVSAMSALEGWLADAPPDSLELTSVAVRQNFHEMPALLQWAADRGLRVDLKPPYPMRQTPDDPYTKVVVRETELLETWLADPGLNALAKLPQVARGRDPVEFLLGAIPHPCIAYRLEATRQVGLLPRVLDVEPSPLPGTEYRSDAFEHADGGGSTEAFAVATVPCPSASRCALASQCPREIYAMYADRFGLDEFVAVRPRELYALKPHAAFFREAMSVPPPVVD